MSKYFGLIIGMMIVTYLPRLLPMLILSKKEMSPFIKKFLSFIPYTALTALIIRGILEASNEMAGATMIGIGVAGVSALFKANMILSVFLGIGATYLFLTL